MEHDSVARSALISRMMDAAAEGIPVNVIIAGVEKSYRAKNPISSGGILSFELLSGNTMRILESSVIGIVEVDQED